MIASRWRGAKSLKKNKREGKGKRGTESVKKVTAKGGTRDHRDWNIKNYEWS